MMRARRAHAGPTAIDGPTRPIAAARRRSGGSHLGKSRWHARLLVEHYERAAPLFQFLQLRDTSS